MFVQRCLTEIGKQTVQTIQRHGRGRRDFHADRLSVLGVVDHEQAVSGRHRLRALLARLVLQVQVRGKRLAFSVCDLK